MKKLFFITLYTTLSIIMFVSCSQETLDSNLNSKDKLSFRIVVPKSSVITRATENGIGNENSINSLRLYFFDPSGVQKYHQKLETFPLNTDILLPITDPDLFKGTVSYTVYAVANLEDADYTLLEGKSLTDFKAYVLKKSIGSTSSGDFLMYSSLTPSTNLNVDDTNNNIGTFEMKRLAVKVRIKLNTNINGYTYKTSKVTLKNITNRTYLDKTGVPSDNTYSDQEKEFSNPSISFYSYPNYWNTPTETSRTFIKLNVTLEKNTTSENKDYFYNVKVNGDTNNILSNHIYEITVNVNKLGGASPDQSIDIGAEFTVKEWIEESFDTDVKAAHYLIVAEKDIEIKNIENHSFYYDTSDDIEIIDKKATFTYVKNTTGQEVTEDATGDQIPEITFDGDQININSKLPENFNPKKITFKVKHIEDTGIAPIEITIWQYPALFITNTMGIKSSRRPHGNLEPHLKNKAMYRITNLIPDLGGQFGSEFENFVIGYPSTHEEKFYRRYSNKYYLVLTDDVTDDSEEIANMISPDFELASQLGASPTMGYIQTYYNTNYNTNYRDYSAVYNCAEYYEVREEIIDGLTVNVKLEDWRLPTRAEIKLIDRLQRLNTAVEHIMNGRYYWSNLSNSAIKVNENGWGGNYNKAYVRCVRDIK